MRKFLSVFIALIGLTFIAVDVDARRMSGGKSIGKQREAINPNQAAPRAPAQQQQATPNTPAQQAAPGAGAAAAQPSGMSRWLGPLAGLAIGAGLASLFLNNGFAGALAGILLAAALAFGIFFLFRLLTRGRTQQAPLRYAGAGPQAARDMPSPAVEPVLQRTSAGSPAPHSVAATTAAPAAAATARWPGFDEAQFVRHARMNFVNLQSAYDRNDISAIRDFVTPELAAEIEKDMHAAGPGEKTDVVTLEAQVLDVATENGLYVVSVRFSGLMREGAAEPQPFAELWHLEKPIDGRSGWVISGIQQA